MAIDTILVIEDDLAIRDSLVTVLCEEGYEVHTAGDGQEALAVLQRLHEPCLMLVDVTMPTMSGWEFLAALEKSSPSLPHKIVVLSASGDAPRGALARGYCFLPKPFELDRFLLQVQRFCTADPAVP